MAVFKFGWLSVTVLMLLFVAYFPKGQVQGEETVEDVMEGEINLDNDLGAKMDGSRTDDEVVAREEEAIKLDGLNVAQMKELRERAEKHEFQAEVNRMMKLIINSLYRNKEIYLRELISNASDALDKIRVLSLTDKDALSATDELSIRIKSDKDKNLLHIIDTGIGMSKQELVTNLGTIAKSGTSDFLQKMSDGSMGITEASDLIGQFGVGFYSSFLVADTVVVTSKSNVDPEQHIWESDSNSFTVNTDPRGDTLKRGTQITLHLKEEAKDFLQEDTLKNLIKKYSQFINFPIYLWSSRTEEVEEEIEDETPAEAAEDEKKEDEDKPKDEDDEAKVEEEKEEEKKKTKKVQKTVWEWSLINSAKPIWTRKQDEVEDSEYTEFYKSISKDTTEPLAKTHFVAEGEVTFKALLFVPKTQPSELFNKYGGKNDNIKLYVRRVFITDDFQDMMPSYLAFVRGVVDSDDLPLNVSRETLQQHKLLKVIKKKLVRKTLDMLKKISEEDYEKFWKEFSTNLKLGVIEDTANRTRLAKLLRFQSSILESGNLTSITDYVSRMKEGQEFIYYIAGTDREELQSSPFVERLIKKGYEILYLTDAVDEYCIGALPEFDGKKFQNIAKEGLELDGSKKNKNKMEVLQKEFEPLTEWLTNDALKGKISKAQISERLHESPSALVANKFGWTGNMERLARSNAHSKSQDVTRDFYLQQKKALEINPRHPIVKELLRRVESDKEDEKAKSMAMLMFETASLRSGYMLQDTKSFASRVETLLKNSLGVDENAEVEEEIDEPEVDEDEEEVGDGESMNEESSDNAEHEEL